MRFRGSRCRTRGHTELKMTPMIDIVFLLLIFFIMTFKIVAAEGNFDVKMPGRTEGPADQRDVPVPVLIRLEADARGRLAAIYMGDRTLDSLDQLRGEIRQMVRAAGRSETVLEVELDCDYHLKFEHAMDAVTAVSGYVDRGQVVQMIDKIRFSTP